MNNNYTEVLNAVKLKLQRTLNPSQDFIENAINKSEIFLEVALSKIQKEKMQKELEAMFQISIASSTQIVKKGWEPWLHLRTQEQKEEYYTNRYKNYLMQNTDMPLSVINEIFTSTDNVLDYLANPLSNAGFKKKGLVVGHVQSGKTANYIALINKAADVGYKLIILIAGVHNNLRTQTQKRVNEGFIGFDSLKRECTGVGKLDSRKTPYCFTDTKNDFKKLKIDNFNPSNYIEPVIAVIKKNSATLKNILVQLSNSQDRDVYVNNYPVLIIDDEADNASINTKSNPDEATKINQQLREILNLFYKASYVGFTATPFANIFINPDVEHEKFGDDLFPDDFIVSLETPSNYFGADEIFIKKNDLHVKTIDDNDGSLPIPLPKDYTIQTLPNSFYDALYLFILSIGIKKIRNIKNPHTSMLVNVTHKTESQKEVRAIVQEQLENLLRIIRCEHKKPIQEAIKNEKMKKLYQLWQNEFDSAEDFHKILDVIPPLDGQIKTLLINSKSKESLDYDDYKDNGGLHVIAIGGYSLSRGFTLEGLTVTYFLRNTAMYDTLLQMGRWFGYRDGYKDLCKIYLTEQSQNWYSYIATVLEELREEFKTLEYHQLSPQEYGLKVRTHPDSLLVTAKNKMHNSKDFILSVSYSEQMKEVETLSLKQESIDNNQNLLKLFLSQLQNPTKINEGLLWSNISIESIVLFLNKFSFHEYDKKEMAALKDYILQGADKELAKWDIYLPIIGDNNKKSKIFSEYNLTMQRRTLSKEIGNYVSFKDGGGRIVRMWDEKIGLTEEQIVEAEKIRESKGIKQSGQPYRSLRKHPLLVLKSLQILSKQKEILAEDVVAFGISFPKSQEDRRVEFKVNKIWLKQKNLDSEKDPDDEERDSNE